MRWLAATAVLLLVACDSAPHVAARVDDGVLRVVVIGDSVAHGAGDERRGGIAAVLQRALPNGDVRNLGIDGARTANVLALLARNDAQAAIAQADVVVLSIGGNDLYGDSFAQLLSGVAPVLQQRRVVARVGNVINRLHELNPDARVLLLGLYNPYRHSTRAAWLERQVNLWDARVIARFAGDRQVTVLRICDLLDRDDRISTIDRFHPGMRGYEAIAMRVATAL
ncbi:MAG TPA: GDSL-type esterase/lipase family protein [Thermoanaerobaculia bacterium]|nr:GDSL-type esterase/lipase family protein [Thermoanaerobaculia bacterium]